MATEYQSKVTTKVAVDGEKEYKAACDGIKTNLKYLGSEMAVVTAKYKDNATSAEALQAKTDVLKKRYAEQEKQVGETKKQIELLTNAEGDHSAKIQKLEKDLNYQQAALYKTTSEIKNTEDATNKLEESTEKASFSFKNFGSVLGSAAGLAVKGAAALGTAAVGAASGLTALTVAGSNYADDVLTLSTNTGIASDELQKYQYALNFIDGDMGTLTKTMEKQKLRMSDAADGNKTMAAAYDKLGVSIKNQDGTFRDSQEVYWEVIDALGGVTDEVERDAIANDLLGKSSKDLRTVIEAGSGAFKQYGEDAEKMGAVMSGDNLNALGLFNDKLQTLKAGMGGLSNAAAMIALPFLDMLAGEGITILGDFTKGIQDANGNMGAMADVLGATLGSVVNLIVDQLPQFIEMGVTMITSLVTGIVDNLPAIITAATTILITLCDGIIELLPMLIEGALQIVIQLAQGIAEALPELIPKLVELVIFIVETLVENLPLIIDAALQLIIGLAQGIIDALPVLIEALPQVIVTIITALVEALPLIATSAGEIITAIVDGIIYCIPLLIEMLPTIITAIINGIVEGLPLILENAIQIIMAIIDGLLTAIPALIAAVPQIIVAIVNALVSELPKILTMGVNILSKLWDGIVSWLGMLRTKVPTILTTIVSAMTSGLSQMVNIGTNIVKGIWSGISGAGSWLWEKITGWASGIVDGIKNAFDINSPSKVMEDEVGIYLAQGVGSGFVSQMETVKSQMAAAIPREFDVRMGVRMDSTEDTSTTKSSGIVGATVQVIQNIYANETSYAAQQREAAKQFKLIARTV